MAFIGIQSGHKNITSNIDPILATETGASGEMAFNWNVTLALSPILQAYGFAVQIDDANANSSSNTIGKDFDFYLAIHAEGAPAGGNIVAPDPSVDSSSTLSKKICDAIARIYFTDTGITNNGIVTSNETFYYMWNLLTAKTPCGIIECGDLADAHDAVIMADTRRVALGIAHGLCSAFNVPWRGDPETWSTPTPTDPCASYKTQIADLQQQIDELKKTPPTIVYTATQTPATVATEIPVVIPLHTAGTSATISTSQKTTQNQSFLDFLKKIFIGTKHV